MLALLADAVSPLMWTTFGHLVVGNALIGVVEALVLRYAFAVPLRRGVLWMVAANYLSMIGGGLLVSHYTEVLQGRGSVALAPGSVLAWIAGFMAAFWAFTVLAEWPFVRGAIGKGGGWRRALAASLLAQTVSYVAVVAFYMTVAPISAVTQTTAVDAAALAPGLAAHVFYLDEDATAVWTVALDGSAPIRVAEVKEGSRDSQLVAAPSTNDVRITECGEAVVPVSGRLPPEPTGWGAASDASRGGWTVHIRFWPTHGLHALHRPTGQELRLALETPFLVWPSRDATLLPGDIVVYTLGPHIVALDLATRRLAVLAQGRSPVVALDAR